MPKTIDALALLERPSVLVYTVSKLLGHTKVENTQIYAKIVNKKKDDAVSLIDQAFE